ncbi:MAG: serine/threonine protein kinase [Candidatus Riflebacteria bacterium]|nr:serine/threonine protein kinase [Candidatus Riflebacteria bacterium]
MKRLGRYEIQKELGAGGMATVHLAYDTTLRRHVALKILPVWSADNPRLAARFQREVRILAGVSHPNIVPIFDVGEEGGQVYYTMEYLPGGSLEGELADGARLPWSRAIVLAREVTSALRCIHRLEIIHRDIKPPNILCSDDGSYKLADFGLGKSQGEDDLTQVGERIGTVRYLPPEGLEGLPMDHTADLFQLGLVLYEAATGQRPYRGQSAMEIIHSYNRTTPVAPSSLCPEIPAPFDTLIQNLLEMKVEHRYPGVEPFAEDLERATTGLPVQRRRPVPAAQATGRLPAPAAATARAGKGGKTTAALRRDTAALERRRIPPTDRVLSGPPSSLVTLRRLPPAVIAGLAVALAALSVVVLGHRSPGPADAGVVTDLTVKVGHKRARVTWSSTMPYRGAVDHGREGQRFVVSEERQATTSHSVDLLDVEPGVAHTVLVRPADHRGPGVKGTFTPAPPVMELALARLTDRSGEIGFKASRTARHTFILQWPWQTERVPIESSAVSDLRLEFSGIGSSRDMKVTIEAANELDETFALDVNQEVETAAHKLHEALGAEDLPRLNRRLVDLTKPGASGLVQAQRLLEGRPFLPALARVASMGLYLLECSAFGLDARLTAYQDLRVAEKIDTFCRLMKIKLSTGMTVQLPPDFRQSGAATLARDAAVDLPLSSDDWLVPADSGLEGLDDLFQKSVKNRKTVKNLTLTVPTGTWTDAELGLTGRFQPTHIVEVEFNGRPGVLFFAPGVVKEEGSSRLFHRLPSGLLREGENRVRIRVQYIPGVTATPLAVTILEAGQLVLAKRPLEPAGKIAVTALSDRGEGR